MILSYLLILLLSVNYKYISRKQFSIKRKKHLNTEDTIAAICTGVGGAISIIRISGGRAREILGRVWQGEQVPGKSAARKMLLGRTLTLDDESGEPAIAVYMPKPNSYTGDDVAEIHCHGGALLTRRVLDAVLKAGARPAEAGEFTYRAFLNGKMDLTQAEAVADLISAQSDMALHLAERQISGKLRDGITSLRNSLTNILAECESRLDFAEEDLDWSDPQTFATEIESLSGQIGQLLDSKTEGAILRQGIRIVIAGKPNVGKSSLLNLLLGYDRAIVTQLPGTTRDTLEEFAHLRAIPVKLIDTAGIREADDLIEGMGIDRSKASIRQAQVVLWLLDASASDLVTECREMREHTGERGNIIAVWNKTDLVPDRELPDPGYPSAAVSISEDRGIEALLDRIEQTVWGFPHTEEPEIAVSSRHAKLLEEARQALPQAVETLCDEDWELAAVQLRAAIAALGQITGEDADPDILDNIFSRFCIGK